MTHGLKHQGLLKVHWLAHRCTVEKDQLETCITDSVNNTGLVIMEHVALTRVPSQGFAIA